MIDLKEKCEQFQRLHVPGTPLVLYNIWDPGSAKAVTHAGAKAIATSSWAVAEAAGFSDGENTPLAFAIDNLSRIVKATKLPVTVDLESGYGPKARDVTETVGLAIEVGAVGCNLEDSVPGSGELRDIVNQTARIAGARKAADAACQPFFINARTDIFIQSSPAEHTVAMVNEAIKRAHAYKKAGANGLFVPGLASTPLIAKLTKSSPLPVNIMVYGATPSVTTLAKNGVARVSHGGSSYSSLMSEFEKSARKVSR
jgi:2-methylisocitrate lyase-like PEP mutase family enzyme